MILAETVGIFIERLGVPSSTYVVGREADDCWCLVEEEGAWKVFWRERGTRFDERVFPDEETACYYLLGRMTHRQLLQGALQAVSAQ